MNWNITAGRPVYVQLVEQLELALVAGSSRPAAAFRPCGSWPLTLSQPQHHAARFAGAGKPRPLQAQRTAGRTVTADDTALQALRRRRAGTLAAEFLHQMQALGLTEAEIETLLRETAQQAPKKE